MLKKALVIAMAAVMTAGAVMTAQASGTSHSTSSSAKATATPAATTAATTEPTTARTLIIPKVDLKTDKFSSWFEEEFENTDFDKTVAFPELSDYTVDATRVEFAQIIYAYLNANDKLSYSADTTNKFTDTTDEAVIALTNAGIIAGVSDTEFDPSSPITREMVATIIARTYDYLGNEDVSATAFIYNDSEDISSWATESIYKLHALGIMKGDENSNFLPKDNVSVEEAIATVIRTPLILSAEIVPPETAATDAPEAATEATEAPEATTEATEAPETTAEPTATPAA